MVCNFGGPQNSEELEPFLSLLLADVLPFPEFVNNRLGAFIAKRRAPLVQPNYEEIGWSPLVPTHDKQVAALKEAMTLDLPVASCQMFTPPFAKTGLQDLLDQGVDHIIAVPMFPHFSFATTNAAYSFMFSAMEELGIADMPVHWVPAYYDHPLYLEALAETIRKGIASTPGEGQTHLIFSPHGLPLSFLRRGDPYPEQIRETARQVMRAMDYDGPWHLGWQSRVGPVKWLAPGTPEVMEDLAKQGVERVTLVPVAFVSDHVETLHEIDIEYAEDAHKMGIPHFGRAPALELEPAFIACLADLVDTALKSFERYQCVRCLHPKPDSHRRQARCPNCRFTFPNYLRRGVQTL
jgi:ferrochelatase